MSAKRCLMCGKQHRTRAELDACFKAYTAKPPSKISPWFDAYGAYHASRKLGDGAKT